MKYFAKEMRHIAGPLVAQPQRALLKGRTIISATRHILDSWYNRIWRNIKSIFLKTDFCKAFDFFNRDALLEILEYYNIPPHLMNVARIALRSSHTRLLGYTDDINFASVTGVRQGCPLSPILYILGVDLLTRGLLKVKGVVALGCYADDNGILVDSVRALKTIRQIINIYCSATGAELNIEKCTLMSNKKIRTPQVWNGITTAESSIYLGIPICVNPSDEAIWRDVRRKVAAAAGEIKKINTTLNHKISLINTYLVSITQYVGCCYLMGHTTASFIWKQIRRCLGVKVAVSNIGLTCDGPLGLSKRIRDPYLANVTSLIVGVPRNIPQGDVSLFYYLSKSPCSESNE
jgi:roadblock/LC7 domain-containing protein